MFKDIKDKKKISYGNILQKLSQENVSIYKQNEKISAERNKLRAELIQIKEEKIYGQEQIIQENEKLKTKLFLIEQKLEKTKNLYEINKKKLEQKNSKISKNNEMNNNNKRSKSNNSKNKDIKKNYTNPTILNNDKSNTNNNINKKFFENILEKKDDVGKENEEGNEIYILEPSKALLKLNNELIFYKESHQKFLAKLKKKNETIIKYENLIDKLNTENTELRKQYKLKLMKINNEKENILSIIVQNNLNIEDQQSNNNNNNNIDNSSNNYNTAHTLEQLNLNNSQLKKIINKNEVIGKESTLEEFGAILKGVGLTRELFERMSQIKGFGKLTDSIEFFYKLCLEKNKQLLILEKENESLVFKNYELNKINIELENELKLYKNNNQIINNNGITNAKKILDDDSIFNNNNTSNNNLENNLNINEIRNNKTNTNNTNNTNINMSNPLLNYKKLLEKQKEEGQLKKAELIFNLSLDKENESSNTVKNSNNNAEIMDNDNDNDRENEENERDNQDQVYSYSKSDGDIQFKESYNEVTNSHIDSIMSQDFNDKVYDGED